MSLQKQVGLDVRVIELRVIQLVGDLLGQLESGGKSGWWRDPHSGPKHQLPQAHNHSTLRGRRRLWVVGVEMCVECVRELGVGEWVFS